MLSFLFSRTIQVLLLALILFPSLLGILDESIESLKNWMISNELTLNTLKTELLVIASRVKVKKVKETLCVHIQGEPIYKSPLTLIPEGFILTNSSTGKIM